MVTLDPGERMRVGAVTVQGNQRLSAPVLRREVPLREGDWFSGSRLAEGQSELFGLDMVRIAVTDTERDSTRDDRVNVRLRITEGALHLISAQVGYGVASGVSGDASWRHRDFLGGARTLEIATTARTGLWAREATEARRYGASVTLRQPYLWDYRIEGVARPFVEYRDDLRDESVEFGGELSLLYRRGPRRNASLRYALTSRRIVEVGAGVFLGEDTDVTDLPASLDTLDLDRRTSSFRLLANWAPAGARDRWRQPDWGLFGSAEVTGPSGFSSVEYGRLVAEATGRMPVGSHVVAEARIGGGRLFPFGASVPSPDGSDRVEAYLQLRDAVLTAGGPRDVRGWGSQLLGPKVPDVQSSGDGSVTAVRYLPLGGFARWTGSVQVATPLPFIGRPHGLHTFLDAGRVWTPDDRFLPDEAPLLPGQFGDDVRFGTGVGVSISTPVGPVQLDLGYKLNPSFLDLRDPGAVARALVEGRPVTDVPAEDRRRWHLHLSIGGVS